MGKTGTLHELTNILAKALRHKIGSMVNPDEIYAQKYARDADVLLREAQKVAAKENWNSYDKIKLKQELRRKLHDELAKKDFLGSGKFELMEDEMNKTLKSMGLL